MRPLAWIAALAAAAALVAGLALRVRGAGGRTARLHRADVPVERPVERVPVVAPRAEDPAPGSTAPAAPGAPPEPTPVRDRRRAEPDRDAVPAHECRVSGRAVDAAGRPVEGAAVELVLGADAALDLRRSARLRPRGARFESSTDAAGAFALRVRRGAAATFRLVLRSDEHAPAVVRGGGLDVARAELGDVVLEPAGALRVRAVGATGDPVHGRFQVLVRSSRAPGALWMDTLARAERGVEVDGLPGGPCTVELLDRSGAPCGGRRAVVVPEDVADVDVTCLDGDPRRRVWVELAGPGGLPVELDAAAVRLSGGGTVGRVAEHRAGTPFYSFDDLEPGEYDVSVEDPLVVPWTGRARPGAPTLRAEVRGSSALAVTVVDAATGAPVPDARLALARAPRPVPGVVHAWRDLPALLSTWELTVDEVRPDGTRVAGGLFAGDGWLHVAADGYASLDVEVPGLAPHETRAVEAALTSGVRVAGSARRAGVTLDGLDVWLLDESPETLALVRSGEARAAWPPAALQGAPGRRTATDRDGAFAFERVLPGRYLLVATDGPGAGASRPLSVGVAPRLREEVWIPRIRGFEGRLTGGGEVPAPSFDLVASWPEEPQPNTRAVTPATDGRYRIDALPLWPVRFELRLWGAGERVRPYTAVDLGRRTVARGPLARWDVELDEARRPGRVDVSVVAPAGPDVLVHLVRRDDPEQGAFAYVEPGGAGESLFVFPGAYDVRVGSSAGGGRAWTLVRAPVEVGPGDVRACAETVELFARDVAFRDATTGDPLADETVRWSADGGPWHSARVGPDGVLTLELPVGPVRFARGEAGAVPVRNAGVAAAWEPYGDGTVVSLPGD